MISLSAIESDGERRDLNASQGKSVDSLASSCRRFLARDESKIKLVQIHVYRERILHVVKYYFKAKAVNEYAQTWSSGTLY